MKRCSALGDFLIYMSAWHHQHLCLSACITDPWLSPTTPQQCALPQANSDPLCLIDQSCLNVIPPPL